MSERKGKSMVRVDERTYEVIACIQSAFKNRKYPGDTNIVYDHFRIGDWECDRLKQLYTGRNCFDINGGILFETREAACLLSTEAFQYFLPGFMIGLLLYPEEADTMHTVVISDLAPSSDEADILELEFRRIDGFSLAERNAIRQFLYLYAERYYNWGGEEEIKQAIRFWESLE